MSFRLGSAGTLHQSGSLCHQLGSYRNGSVSESHELGSKGDHLSSEGHQPVSKGDHLSLQLGPRVTIQTLYAMAQCPIYGECSGNYEWGSE